MSSDLVPYRSGGRLPKAVSQELAHIQHGVTLRAAAIQGNEFVTMKAMFAITRLSGIEGHLFQMVPLAEPRLKEIADIAALTMAAEVAKGVGGLS